MIDQQSPTPTRLLPLGDAAWTVEFGRGIDAATHARVLGYAAALAAATERGRLEGIVEWVPTFRSVTVHFDPLAVAPDLPEQLLALADDVQALDSSGCRWRIPVCFDAEFAPDLGDVAAARGLSEDEVLRLMTQTVFSVYMLGFLPGFPYLGGLPKALEMPRLATPRKLVPARSIAVAGSTCAAYPWESPGGWRLLGRTPVRLFDADNPRRPALLAPGDEVQWQAIDRRTYDAIEAECVAGRFDTETLRTAEAAA